MSPEDEQRVQDMIEAEIDGIWNQLLSMFSKPIEEHIERQVEQRLLMMMEEKIEVVPAVQVKWRK